MRARLASAPGAVVLPVLFAAAFVAVVAGGHALWNPGHGSARQVRATRTSAVSQALPKLTFSPRSSLARLDLRTGEVHPLAAGALFSAADPSFSPSGELAFIASRCAACAQTLAIVRGRRADDVGAATSVAWMGSSQLVTSVGRGEHTEIRVVGQDGRGHELRWLSAAAERAGLESKKEVVVSPDRRLLLFSGEGSAEHHGNYLVDLVRRRLVPLAGEAEGAPAFSPDSRAIAYQRVSRSGDWDVCVSRVSARGAAAGRCFPAPGDDREPAFLPGASALVFASDRAAPRSGVASLYRLDLRTGAVTRLTGSGYDATSPAVAPDGRSIVFVRRALVPLR